MLFFPMHKLQKEGHKIRLSSEMEKSLFLIRLTRIRNQLISDVLDLLFQIRNIERRFADDNGLAVFCRRVYFLWRAALADYIILWDSHMPHIIPSIFKTVLIIQYLLSSGNTAKRKRAGLYSWDLMKNLKSHTLSGYLKYSADEKKCQ